MKLSDLKSSEIQPISVPAPVQSNGLSLSQLSPESVQAAEQFSPLESAGLGAANGATLNFEPAIEGAGKALYKKATGEQGNLSDLYEQYRKLAAKRLEDAKASNPKSYLAGELAGGIAPAVLAPEALGLKAATMGGAAATGALLGAGGALGEGVSKEQGVAPTAINAGIGALTSGALGAATQGIANKFLNPEALENSAAVSAIKGIGGKPYAGKSIPGTTDLGNNLGVGKTLLEQNALPLKGGAEGIQTAIQKANDLLQVQNAPITASAAQEIFNNPNITAGKLNIAPKVEQAMYDMIGELPGNQGNINLGQSIEKDLQPLLAKLDAAGNDPQLLEQVKREFQAIAKQKGAFTNTVEGASDTAKIYGKLAGIVKDDVENLVEMATPGTNYNETNQSISDLIKAQSTVEKPGGILSQDLANPPGSFTGAGLKAAGTLGLGVVTGHPWIGTAAVAAGIAKTVAENATGTPIGRFANILAARGKYALSQNAPGVQQTVGALGRTGVQAGLSTYMASPEHLKSIADEFQKSDTTKNLGVALNKALQSGDQNSIRGVTFAIEQNPYSRLQARQLLSNFYNDAGGKEDGQ